MRRHSFKSDSARRAFCVAAVVGIVALALCSDANVLTRLHIMNTAKAEDILIGALHPQKLAADATSPHGFPSLLGDDVHVWLETLRRHNEHVRINRREIYPRAKAARRSFGG